LNDSLFDVPPLAPATPGQFRDRVAGELRQHGCSGVARADGGSTLLRAVEPDGRSAIWVTVSRAEKNDKFGFGWTIQASARAFHRTIEIAGDPVMYALQAEGEIRVVPGDFLIEGVTLAEGRGGHSEHVLIVDGRWPTLEAYLSGRA
jgi:hypothetical protein